MIGKQQCPFGLATIAAILLFGLRAFYFTSLNHRPSEGGDKLSSKPYSSFLGLQQRPLSPHPDKDAPIPAISIGVDIMGKEVFMPLLGAGTGHFNDSVAYQSVCKSFLVGYTMVDTAHIYGNQKGVGQAIRDCWNRPRSNLFVLTKIPGGLTREEVWSTHEQNLRELQLDYVDHLMIHYSADWNASKGRASRERRQEGWNAMQEIYQTGAARSIGVSHYCPRHLEDVLQVSRVVAPSINQVEYHVGSGDVDHVMAHCLKHNITFMSFSPLCGPCDYEPKDSLTTGDLVTEIASHYDNVTGSQVALRFIVQQALEKNVGGQPVRMGGVIPKSNNLHHLELNRGIFSFSLTKEDMARLRLASRPSAKEGDCNVP
ncbi:hypothetical protein ACA910_006107 [Epithemia clementina (nom. ined.)]